MTTLDDQYEDEGTGYHASVKDLRTEILKSAAVFEQMSREHLEPIMRAGELARATGDETHRASVPSAVRDAHQASLMAYGYGYTLAAVLRLAEQKFGKAVAHRLACAADNILMNGDDDDLNDDIESEPAAQDG